MTETALDKARDFFRRRPDEVLTRQDIRVKFECCARTAGNVAKALIREGVPRCQLPRAPRRSRARQFIPPTFPVNLTPAERKAIEGVMDHGSIGAAAVAAGLAYNSIEAYLRDARRKAGVNSTADLVDRFRREATSPATA